jgi:hypothetical protein
VGTLAVRDNSIVAFATTYAAESEIRACADRINALAASGRLSARVARTLPLSEARRAHELIEDKDVRCWELLARPMFGAMPTLSLPVRRRHGTRDLPSRISAARIGLGVDR